MDASPKLLLMQIKEAMVSASGALDLSKQINLENKLAIRCHQATGCLLSVVLSLEQTEKILKSILDEYESSSKPSKSVSSPPKNVTEAVFVEDDFDPLRDQDLDDDVKEEPRDEENEKETSTADGGEREDEGLEDQEEEKDKEKEGERRNEEGEKDGEQEGEWGNEEGEGEQDGYANDQSFEHVDYPNETFEEGEYQTEPGFEDYNISKADYDSGLQMVIRKKVKKQCAKKKKMCRPDCPQCSKENCMDLENCKDCRANNRCKERACPEYDLLVKIRRGEMICDLCGSQFNSFRNFRRHQRITCGPNHKDKVLPFKCLMCEEENQIYNTYREYSAHIQETDHGMERPKKLCPSCSDYIILQSYNRHVKNCKGGEVFKKRKGSDESHAKKKRKISPKQITARTDKPEREETMEITIKSEPVYSEEEEGGESFLVQPEDITQDPIYDHDTSFQANENEEDPDFSATLKFKRRLPTKQYNNKKRMCHPDCPQCNKESCFDFANCKACRSGHRCPQRACEHYDAKKKNVAKAYLTCQMCGAVIGSRRNLQRHMAEVCEKNHKGRVLPFKCLVCPESDYGDHLFNTFKEYTAHAEETGHNIEKPKKLCALCSEFIPIIRYNIHVGHCKQSRPRSNTAAVTIKKENIE